MIPFGIRPPTPPPHPCSRDFGLLVAVLAALAGCNSGHAEIHFEFPAEGLLSRADIGEVTLVVTQPEQSPVSSTRQVAAEGSVDLGELPVDEDFLLAVEFRTRAQRLIGYGRSAGAVRLAGESTTHIPVLVRKPFALLGGAPSVLVGFDTTKDGNNIGGAFTLDITTPSPPVAVAVTGEGRTIATTDRDGNVALIATSNHLPETTTAIRLTTAPSVLAASNDGRYLVAGHAGAAGGVSVVDLESARAGQPAITFVPLGNVGDLAVGRTRDGGERVLALLDRDSDATCGGAPSRIAMVSLGATPTPAGTRDIGAPVRDLAAGPLTTSVVLADPCNNRILIVDPDDDTAAVELARVQNASVVAILGEQAWAVGALPFEVGRGARMLLVSIDLDGERESRVELAPIEERAVSLDFVQPGQQALQRMDADTALAIGLAVVPGGNHVALLTEATFHAEEMGSFLGQPILPAMDMATSEYTLIDTASGAVVQRVRTACALTWERDPLLPPVLDAWDCGRAPGQDVTTSAFAPRQLAVVFGAN